MNEKPNVDITAIVPIEKITYGNGAKETVCKAIGTSKEAVDAAVQFFVETQGAQLVKYTGTSKQFGLSGNWNAPWNPTGPKPNWVQPKDPSKN